MKKILILVTIILIVGIGYFKAKSQTTATTDIISLSQFDLIPSGAAVSGSNTALLDSALFLQKFGNPISATNEQSEIDDLPVSHYTYAGAEAWFMSNKLLGMNITSSNYVFTLSDGSSTIKVGDHIPVLINLFPQSWSLMNDMKVFVGLRNSANEIVDTNLIFEFDSSGTITSIAIQ